MNDRTNPTTRVDVVGTIVYQGECTPGTPATAAGSRISRTDTATGNITFASTGDFDQVWTNHLNLVYA